MDASPPPAEGLLVSGDLFFASKVTGTAQALGFRVETAGTVERALSRIAGQPYRCVLIDLALPGLEVRQITAVLPPQARPRTIAFGSHVDTARLEEARSAGCDDVMPRSRFSATLPDLLREALG